MDKREIEEALKNLKYIKDTLTKVINSAPSQCTRSFLWGYTDNAYTKIDELEYFIKNAKSIRK
ncbi:hypothetical protein M2S00_06795 [Apilactobacillus sp. TMW 2.2459]|uniref:hypothetical protein n=1 Tax=Apilactobacillus xinyiensis TaxID=2841032 RepID=UPI00200F3CEF|nr:hypothetical protein [Apilactobacillus xinyiensis]MCL0312812.1 hypothetical protein [Apilactobacillus xinyiensis]